MEKTILWAFCILLILPTCTTLNFSEFINKDHIEFDSIKLMPAADPYGFRTDLIRKSQSIQTDDSTQITDEMPYSRLGFCLGNGLFYDLYGNLSISPLFLLGFSVEEEFDIENTNKRGRSTLYQFTNDTLSLTALPKGKRKVLYSKTSKGDSTAFKPKRGRPFSFIKTDSSIQMTGKRRTVAGIYSKGKNRYGLNAQKKKVRFRLSENSALLNHDMIIRQSADRKTIQLLKYRKRQSSAKPIFTMVRSDNTILIYNQNNRGLQIEISNNKVYVSKGNKIVEVWTLHQKTK